MGRLGLDVLDLFLIHWPAPGRDRYVETWQALRELRDDGRVRAIGVCNFHAPHLQRLFDETGEWPSINQVELHPYLQQTPLREFARRARHRHRVVEPARVGQAGARRPGDRADRAAARGDPGAGRHRAGTSPSGSWCCRSR